MKRPNTKLKKKQVIIDEEGKEVVVPEKKSKKIHNLLHINIKDQNKKY